MLLMIDADHFKSINDRFGHAAGDRCLTQIAALLRGVLREGDLAGRLGGEEFGVFLPAITLYEARFIADRISRGVVLRVRGVAEPKRVTLSVGMASLRGRTDLAQVLRRADAALYRAKDAGRARAVLAPSDEAAATRSGAGPPTTTRIRVERCATVPPKSPTGRPPATAASGPP